MSGTLKSTFWIVLLSTQLNLLWVYDGLILWTSAISTIVAEVQSTVKVEFGWTFLQVSYFWLFVLWLQSLGQRYNSNHSWSKTAFLHLLTPLPASFSTLSMMIHLQVITPIFLSHLPWIIKSCGVMEMTCIPKACYVSTVLYFRLKELTQTRIIGRTTMYSLMYGAWEFNWWLFWCIWSINLSIICCSILFAKYRILRKDVHIQHIPSIEINLFALAVILAFQNLYTILRTHISCY